MTNKKKIDIHDPEGYDKVLKMFEEAGLIDIYSDKEKKGIIGSHKRVKFKVLRRTGKIGFFTLVLYVVLNSLNKSMGKALGAVAKIIKIKMISIPLAAGITIGGGYYVVKKTILSSPPQDKKKVEQKVETTNVPDKQIKKIPIKLKKGFYFQFDEKRSNITKAEQKYFTSHIYKYLYAKETQNYFLVIKIAQLENIYSVSLSLQDIDTMKVIDSKGSMVKGKQNAVQECVKYALYFREKYLKHNN